VTKILVVKPSSLGDVVHVLPVATALVQGISGCMVDWVVRPEYAELLEAHPAVRRVLLFDRKRWGDPRSAARTVAEVFDLVRSLRRESYHVVLDLQGLLRSGLIAMASGVRRRIGLASAREAATLFYTESVPVPDPRMHAVDRYRLVLGRLGVEGGEVRFDLTVPAAAAAWAERLLEDEAAGKARPTVVLNPHARWETKEWLPDRWAAVADRLTADTGASVFLVGGGEDREATAAVEAGVRSRVVNLAGGTTLVQLAALLARADLLVTCDSGPMHLAAAAGTPVLALFGPTDPARTGPYGSDHRVLRGDADCAACLRRRCPKEERVCMTSISTTAVVEAAVEMLGRTVPAPGREGGS